MEVKLEKNLTDYGCGFPVTIERVLLGKFGNEWIPLIDYGELERRILALLDKKRELTKQEQKFVRLHYGVAWPGIATDIPIDTEAQPHIVNVPFNLDLLDDA